ncbi:hypothetical protein vseg_017932 [Gypsophila vaccaria]
MATSSIDSSTRQKKGSPRRLFELLEEKQEPFVLEIYLIERGCRRDRLEFVDSSRIGDRILGNNFGLRNFERTSGDQSPDSNVRKSSLRLSSIARSLYSKIVLVNGVLRPKLSSKKKKKKKTTRWDDKEGCAEPGRCSGASFSTSKTWSESDTDRDSVSSSANDETAHKKMGPHRVMGPWRFAEENKQFSPDSVLDEIDLLQAIPVYNVRRKQYEPPTAPRIRPPKKVSEDSILSATLWEMLEQTKNETANKFGSKSFPKYMNSMKAMLQSRQLLFDCVRDAVETKNSSKNRRVISREKGLMGSEEIGKIMSNNLKTWGKFPTIERRTKRLMKTDLLSSDESEWREFRELKREIAMEIGNGLFDDITDEIIRDMVDQF